MHDAAASSCESAAVKHTTQRQSFNALRGPSTSFFTSAYTLPGTHAQKLVSNTQPPSLRALKTREQAVARMAAGRGGDDKKT